MVMPKASAKAALPGLGCARPWHRLPKAC